MEFFNYRPKFWADIIPDSSVEGLDLVDNLVRYRRDHRMSAAQVRSRSGPVFTEDADIFLFFFSGPPAPFPVQLILTALTSSSHAGNPKHVQCPPREAECFNEPAYGKGAATFRVMLRGRRATRVLWSPFVPLVPFSVIPYNG